MSVAAVAIGRFATESLRKYPGELWRSAAATIPLQRLGEVEEYGWLIALLASRLGRALSGSVITLDGALDNWTGRWPPDGLGDGRQVPTEERRPAHPAVTARPPGYHHSGTAGEVLWLHRSLPSF